MTIKPSSSDNDSENRVVPDAEFVELFTRHQRRLFLLILGQIPDPMEAEEILQNVNVVIWKKCGRFEPGTNFLAWAAAIANLEVLKFRSLRAREKLVFSDDFLASIAQEVLDRSDELERRRAALKTCIEKLSGKDRSLIELRYAPGESGKGLAERLGRPVNSVYQSLGRIRRALWECVERQLKLEAG